MKTVESKRRNGRAWKLLMIFLVLGGIWLLYGVLGNNQEVAVHGHSAILWMVKRWSGSGGDLSHGWIIPLVSIYAIWRKRRELTGAPKSVNYMGLLVIVLSLLLHWMGFKAQLTRISLLSLIGLLWGIPFYLLGRQVAKILIFPCAYLIFCIPLSFLNNITVPLRILASSLSASLLNGLGISTVRAGTAIHSMAGGGFSFDVADPCSGLRSLIALTALTAAYAYLTQRSLLKKWVLFLAAIPLAIVGNVARIVTIAIVAQGFGQERALHIYHNYSGFIVFSVAVLLMMGFGAFLNVNYAGKLKKWKLQHTDTIS